MWCGQDGRELLSRFLVFWDRENFVVGLSAILTGERGGMICGSNTLTTGIFSRYCPGSSVLGRTLGRTEIRRAKLGVPGVRRIAGVSKG